MEQNPVAVLHAARGQTAGRRLDTGVEVSPCPGGVAPDQRGPVGKPPRGLDQQMREVGSRDQRRGSRMDT
jgi:hypothetical protein